MVTYVITIIMVHDTQTLDVWYIYLHLVNFHGRCRYINHTWILWDSLYHKSSMILPKGPNTPWWSNVYQHRLCPGREQHTKPTIPIDQKTDSQSQGVKDKGVPKFCWVLLGVLLGFQLYYTCWGGCFSLLKGK